MTARVLRLAGAALMWAVLLVACAVALALCLPVLLVAGLLRGLYELGRALARRGEKPDVPDGLDELLRAEIDGDGEAYDTELLDEGHVLCCGCRPVESEVARCPRCDWVTCVDHIGAPHLCERDPIASWQNVPLPVVDAAASNAAFADLINSARELGDLRNTGRTLSRYYLIGDEK